MCNSNREHKKVVTVPLFNNAIIAKANSERIFINQMTEKGVETIKNPAYMFSKDLWYKGSLLCPHRVVNLQRLSVTVC